MFKKFLPLALLASFGVAIADDCCNTGCSSSSTSSTVTNCFLPRSQGRDMVKKNAGLDPDHRFLFDMDNIYFEFDFGVEYTQSFSGNKIGRCLFGPAVTSNLGISSTSSIAGCCKSDCGDDSVTIRIAGGGAPTPANGTSDLLASNFFLPYDFSSTVTFKPKISNINVPLHFYVGLDEWCSGLYFRAYAPITNTRWKLDANETITNPGVAVAVAGIISPNAVPSTALYTSFLSYTCGGNITLPSTPIATPAVTVQPLDAQRICSGCEATTKTGLADLRAELGWNFVLDEDYHFGLNIQVAAPTGNDCNDNDCKLLFAPIVGNGKHWELGGGVTGHYTFWRSEDEEQEFGFYVDADITHLFKHSETRVFDLVGKPLSRYMFAQQVGPVTTGLLVGGTAPNFQFANVFAPVANFAQQQVDTSFDVQGDVAAKFVYTCRGFSWELGYNFWGRSCEKVDVSCSDECNNTTGFNNSTTIWALGANCLDVFGFASGTDTPVALPRTASNSTVFRCGTVDNPQTTVTTTLGGTVGATNVVLDPNTASPIITASNPGIAITADDLDMTSGATRGISHKIFTHFNYTWIECENWIPFIGFGASGEFASNKSHGTSTSVSGSSTTTNCNSSCDNGGCSDCGLSQWAVWFKGGLSFN